MLSRCRRPFRLVGVLVPVLLVSQLLASCADTQATAPSEGSVAFKAGLGPTLRGTAAVEPGPPLVRLGILTSAVVPRWNSAWIAKDPKQSSSQGAQAGFIAGMGMIQMAPLALAFWPAAVGVAAGMTAMGIIGSRQEETDEMRRAAPDRAAIADATTKLRPDQILREAFSERLARRTGRPIVPVLLQDANVSGSDPLDEARQAGLDGMVDLQIESLGLAAGEDTTTFGIFAQVRMRLVDVQGRLRYERTVAYGPGQPAPELPQPTLQTLEFLAMDRALVYRQSARETIRWIALLFAQDPGLPVK
jgi:hypothetical protein